MKKILTVVGARPQFVKAAVVSQGIKAQTNLKEILVHTGQHFDTNMSQLFFDELELPPIAHQLSITSSQQGKQTAEMLIGIEKVMLEEKPDYIIIYGDTNSTLAASLAAAKLHIPIAHIESGLRSYNRKMPEEVNRIVADQLADILFTPTRIATANLKREGFPASRIVEVGDVMYDAALYYGEKATTQSHILQKLNHQDKPYILATIHRAENTDNEERLLVIFTALEKISKTMPIIMPLHPRTQKVIAKHFPQLLNNTHITIIEPVGFLDMIMLEKQAKLIITDSGGVQKEAFFYKVPCMTLREETEWVETVELQWNRVVTPYDPERIYQQAFEALGSHGLSDHYPYGQGNAAQLIAQHLV